MHSAHNLTHKLREADIELSERQIYLLRGLRDHPANDIPGGYVDDDMDELIDVGYVTVRIVGDLFSYDITDDGRAALKRSEGEA
jgi:hypothetical protein